MAGTDQPPVVTDAGPLIHLDELTSLDLLRGFPTILVPREVWTEIVCHRPRLTPGDVPGAGIVSVSDSPGPGCSRWPVHWLLMWAKRRPSD